MEWIEAERRINSNVKVGTDVNTPKSNYRFVVESNSRINSKRYKYVNEKGFIVSIGRNSNIEIPWSVLKECFNKSKPYGFYDGILFRKLFPLQAKDHPCHVHVIGKIFDVAGMAYYDGKKYRIV